jgi:hypothetical protein
MLKDTVLAFINDEVLSRGGLIDCLFDQLIGAGYAAQAMR